MMNKEDSGLRQGERLDDLQIKGYEIIQSPGRFCFGMDAVLLSSFAAVKMKEKVLDIGTGTGILQSFLQQRMSEAVIQGLRFKKKARIWQDAVYVTINWKIR